MRALSLLHTEHVAPLTVKATSVAISAVLFLIVALPALTVAASIVA